ncbi:hypothetical protein [Actinoalloteichus sp. GBA129-24]|uniref:hypothetical protein n=1 Tax=Actinoalloteichus sp. GBA129-24 TaxID=1612551 RepID=UPI0009508B1A|nr:hypothetical protein [Actinoalloteichus sp. GBA129-24]APU22206.1 hypothetical protein UA75_21085 [Actinoalloteichus sp. GBA129-24]
MTSRRPRLLGALAVAALLTGCATEDRAADVAAAHSANLVAPTTTGTTAAPTSDTEEDDRSAEDDSSSELTVSERGLGVKEIGEAAGFGEPDRLKATFTVDAITVDAGCTDEWATAAEHGRFVILDMTIATTAELTASDYWAISTHDFGVISPDGVAAPSPSTVAAYSCLTSAEQFPSGPLLPDTQYHGRIALDTAHESGIITYRPAGLIVGNGGWEWEF